MCVHANADQSLNKRFKERASNGNKNESGGGGCSSGYGGGWEGGVRGGLEQTYKPFCTS